MILEMMSKAPRLVDGLKKVGHGVSASAEFTKHKFWFYYKALAAFVQLILWNNQMSVAENLAWAVSAFVLISLVAFAFRCSAGFLQQTVRRVQRYIDLYLTSDHGLPIPLPDQRACLTPNFRIGPIPGNAALARPLCLRI
jgi:hypothetical protein